MYWVAFDVFQFGSCKRLSPNMTLVPEAMCIRYPDILESHNRKKLLRMYNTRDPEIVDHPGGEGVVL